MKRIYIYLVSAVFLLGLLVSIGCNGGGSGPQQMLNDQGYWQISSSNITLQWKIVGTDLEVILSAPITGWVAVGFDPSNRMQGANIILGRVVPVNVLEVRDDYGSAPTAHSQDVTNNVTGVEGTEQGGTTTVRFTIPLDSGDPEDKLLVQGTSYRVLLSYGSSDNFDQQHAVKTAVTITL
jgi:hypothetical protein